MIRQLTVEEISARWAELAPRVQRAIVRGNGEYDIEDIYRDLVSEDIRFWVLEGITGKLSSICVTQVIRFDRISVCSIIIAEGHTDSRWLPAIERIGSWAKAQGCSRLEARARPGWKRSAAVFGFKYLHTTIAKQL
jgi:hypothetical protein